MEETVPTNTIPLAPHKPAYHYIMYRPCKIYYYLHNITYHVYRIPFNIKLTVWHLWTSNNKCRVLTNKFNNFFTHYHYFSHVINRETCEILQLCLQASQKVVTCERWSQTVYIRAQFPVGHVDNLHFIRSLKQEESWFIMFTLASMMKGSVALEVTSLDVRLPVQE